jgi:hypothetical protein
MQAGAAAVWAKIEKQDVCQAGGQFCTNAQTKGNKKNTFAPGLSAELTSFGCLGIISGEFALLWIRIRM